MTIEQQDNELTQQEQAPNRDLLTTAEHMGVALVREAIEESVSPTTLLRRTQHSDKTPPIEIPGGPRTGRSKDQNTTYIPHQTRLR